MPRLDTGYWVKNVKLTNKVFNLYRIKWLRYVLCMPNHRLPEYEILASVEVDSKEARNGETKTDCQLMNSLTVGLSHISRC